MMTARERKARNLVSWVPGLGSLVLFILLSGYLYKAQHDYALERARADLFSTVFTNSENPFLVVNNEGLITDWNPAAEKKLGWAREEVLGSDLIFLMSDKNMQYQHAKMWDQDVMSKKLAGRALRVRCWMNRKGDDPIKADLEINEIKAKGTSFFTAEIIPRDYLFEIDHTNKEPGDQRQPPDKRENFDPVQQIKQLSQQDK